MFRLVNQVTGPDRRQLGRGPGTVVMSTADRADSARDP